MSQSGKILIVEDEHVLARNLQMYLRGLGWETRVAGTGMSAITAAVEFRPGIVLLDYYMPDMNGLEILQAIRAEHCCACILMTGHPEHVLLTDARQLGVAHILAKPFSMTELNSAFLTSAAQYCVRCFQDRDDAAGDAAASQP